MGGVVGGVVGPQEGRERCIGEDRGDRKEKGCCSEAAPLWAPAQRIIINPPVQQTQPLFISKISSLVSTTSPSSIPISPYLRGGGRAGGRVGLMQKVGGRESEASVTSAAAQLAAKAAAARAP